MTFLLADTNMPVNVSEREEPDHEVQRLASTGEYTTSQNRKKHLELNQTLYSRFGTITSYSGTRPITAGSASFGYLRTKSGSQISSCSTSEPVFTLLILDDDNIKQNGFQGQRKQAHFLRSRIAQDISREFLVRPCVVIRDRARIPNFWCSAPFPVPRDSAFFLARKERIPFSDSLSYLSNIHVVPYSPYMYIYGYYFRCESNHENMRRKPSKWILGEGAKKSKKAARRRRRRMDGI